MRMVDDTAPEATPKKMVGLGRLERPTSPLSGVRSNHLSYRPRMIMTHTAKRGTDHAIRKNEKEKRGRRRPAYRVLTEPFVSNDAARGEAHHHGAHH